MGWFSWFSREPDSSSGVAPDRSQRKACWDARDAYYACLDKNSVLKPGEEQNVCTKEKKSYTASCAKSWVGQLHTLRMLYIMT
jgi:cytochrome c oxidase assembly factor 6